MAEESKTPEKTSAAGQGAPDIDAIVSRAVEKAVGAVTEKLTPLAQAIASLQQGQQALSDAVKTIPTPEALSKAATDAVSAQNAGQAKVDGVKAYRAEKAKDLPPIYQGLIAGDTPEALAKSEQAAREQFRNDFKAAGGKTPPVDGGTSAGVSPLAVQTGGKMSYFEELEAGVRETRIKPVSGSLPPVRAGEGTAAAGTAGSAAGEGQGAKA